MEIIRELGEWWNLIYAIPFGLGILMAVFSAASMARVGGHRGGRMGGTRAVGTRGTGAARGAGRTGGARARGAASGTHARGTAPGAQGQARPAAGGAQAQAQPAATRGSGGSQSARSAGSARGARGAAKAGRGAREGGRRLDLLAAIGVGKVPLPVVLQALFTSWGLFGWFANRGLEPILRAPGAFILPSLGIASVTSILFTRVVAEGLGRITPDEGETYALEAEDLIDSVGTAVFRVTETTGSVHVYDATGALHELRARCRPSQPGAEKGESVLVVDYDPANRWYWVERWSEEETA